MCFLCILRDHYLQMDAAVREMIEIASTWPRFKELQPSIITKVKAYTEDPDTPIITLDILFILYKEAFDEHAKEHAV